LAVAASRLERLDLASTSITSASCATLARFSNLRTLVLRATSIPLDDAEAIGAALPKLGGIGTGSLGEQEGLIW
jgi:hypothetical protein